MQIRPNICPYGHTANRALDSLPRNEETPVAPKDDGKFTIDDIICPFQRAAYNEGALEVDENGVATNLPEVLREFAGASWALTGVANHAAKKLTTGGDWSAADARTGAVHMERAPIHFEAPSPFDYANRAEVLIVTDIKRGDLAALAGAYARLIVAAQGGTLGLFTAIRRLRGVHARIADRLAREGLPLYAQHVDPIDVGTLVDIFRDDRHASLLGTDALRDGVDVPGHSLRLVVMEGVPWSKPTVLHAARKLAHGGSAYDDLLIRGRLAQAFGRLIRTHEDRGQFVLLSAAVPSRLLTAFPEGTPIRRVTIDEAATAVRDFENARIASHVPIS